MTLLTVRSIGTMFINVYYSQSLVQIRRSWGKICTNLGLEHSYSHFAGDGETERDVCESKQIVTKLSCLSHLINFSPNGIDQRSMAYSSSVSINIILLLVQCVLALMLCDSTLSPISLSPTSSFVDILFSLIDENEREVVM